LLDEIGDESLGVGVVDLVDRFRAQFAKHVDRAEGLFKIISKAQIGHSLVKVSNLSIHHLPLKSIYVVRPQIHWLVRVYFSFELSDDIDPL